jgi:hypothetical protein
LALACKAADLSAWVFYDILTPTTHKGEPMPTEYRPDVLGATPTKTASADPQAVIQQMETELKQMAESLRKTRYDFVNGMISDKEFESVEAQFAAKLAEHRQILQNLRSAAKEK